MKHAHLRVEQQIIEAIQNSNPLETSKAHSLFDAHSTHLNLAYQEHSSNRTMLHYACVHGNEPLVKAILGMMSSKKWLLPDDYGHTALHLACQHGRRNIVALFLDKLARGRPCQYPLPALLKHALEAPDLFGSIAFHVACQYGHLEVVREILSRFSDEQIIEELITRVDIDGRSPFFVACEKGHAAIVSLLLMIAPNSGKLVNQADRYGITPLLTCSQQGNIEAILALLEDPDLNINVASGNGETPLMAACHAPNGTKITKCLMASFHQLNTSATMKEHTRRVTAADLAIDSERTDILKMIMAYDEDPEKFRAQCQTKLGLKKKYIAELFGIVVLLSDQYFDLPVVSFDLQHINHFKQVHNKSKQSPSSTGQSSPQKASILNQFRFLNIARKLPLDLQMVLCNRWGRCARDVISVKDSEMALKKLATRIMKMDKLENTGRFKTVKKIIDWIWFFSWGLWGVMS